RCFFFASRRRHTRSLCDWSSDVCSSDLSLGDSNPCFRRERATSWAARRRELKTLRNSPDPPNPQAWRQHACGGPCAIPPCVVREGRFCMIEKIAGLVNADARLVHRGRFVDTTFMIVIDDAYTLLRVQEGRITQVKPG